MNTNPNLPPHFWAHVDKTPTCWLWTGTLNKPNGYGWFNHKGKQVLAHRFICADIPPDMCVLHTCDTPRCVNPDHLFFGTKADNARDAVSKNRDSAFLRAKITPQAVVELRKLPRTIEVARAAAAKYGVALSTINQIQNHHTWKRVDTGPKPDFERTPRTGERSGNAKLTEADVHDIRRAPKAYGVSAQLAREYGVTPGAIQAIRDGSGWKDLPWEEGVTPHAPRQQKLLQPPRSCPAATPRKRALTLAQKRLRQQEARRQRASRFSP